MTPCSDAYFASPLALRTPGKQCGLTATGLYQPSLRSPWLEADEAPSKVSDYKIWDLATRLFHWTLVSLVAALFISADTTGNAIIHRYLGFAALTLLLFRICLGFYWK
ncbi:MAG: hypothetical protein GY814_01940 [Gammaproteobacteria bacterium]|nr:hypothetical protein [Gammaproteobacteria bacterium]